MSYQLQPGAGFIFMKVGVHAQETLTDIIARKQRELKDAVDADARPMRHGQLRPDTASRPTGRRPARTGGASLADDPGFSTRGSAALPFTMLVGA